MKTRLSCAILLAAVWAATALGQAAPKPEKITSLEGITEYRLSNGLTVLLFPDATKSTITVSTKNARRDVSYSADTKFLYGHSNNNKPGSVDQVKDNYYVSCSGTFEAGKVQLTARECIYRETK